LENIKIARGKERGITDGILEFLKKRPVYACEFKGEWYTVGDKQGFLKANIYFGLKDKQIKKELKTCLKKTLRIN